MKVYVVTRRPDGHVHLTVDGSLITPDRALVLRRAKTTTHMYGFIGEGPTVLALSILLDALGGQAEAALIACEAYAAEFLGTAASDSDELRFTDSEIRTWFKHFAVSWEGA